MNRIAIVVLASLSLSACKFSFDSADSPKPSPPPPDPISGCWNPSIKIGEQQLAGQLALTNFVKSLPPDFAPEDISKIKSSFHLTVDEFMTFSYEKSSDSLTCGADFSYTYVRPDGSTMTHDSGDVLKFEVYQSENGPDPMMSGVDQSAINIQYETADNAAKDGDQTDGTGAN